MVFSLVLCLVQKFKFNSSHSLFHITLRLYSSGKMELVSITPTHKGNEIFMSTQNIRLYSTRSSSITINNYNTTYFRVFQSENTFPNVCATLFVTFTSLYTVRSTSRPSIDIVTSKSVIKVRKNLRKDDSIHYTVLLE